MKDIISCAMFIVTVVVFGTLTVGSLMYGVTYFQTQSFNKIFDTTYSTDDMFFNRAAIQELHIGTKHRIQLKSQEEK